METKHPLGLIPIIMLCATLVSSCVPTYDDDEPNLKPKPTIEVQNVSTSYYSGTHQNKRTYYIYDAYCRDNDVPNLRERNRPLEYSFYTYIHNEPQARNVWRTFGVDWSFVVKGELHQGKELSLEYNSWNPVWTWLGEISNKYKASGTAVVTSLTNEYVTITFEDVSFEGNYISINRNPPSEKYTFNGVVKYKRKKYNDD